MIVYLNILKNNCPYTVNNNIKARNDALMQMVSRLHHKESQRFIIYRKFVMCYYAFIPWNEIDVVKTLSGLTY